LTFVLDASLTLSWFFEDEKSEDAQAVKSSLRRTDATTAVIWPAEVANGLITAERRKRISERTVERAPQILRRLPIRIDKSEPNMVQLITLARKHGLTAYDTLYLHLAVDTGLPIATLDDALDTACRTEGILRFQP
jgi:predicted nucleic acid-binding protein